MILQCIICSDLIGPVSEVYSTTCGHMFHYTCLIQWMERSKTCPQCRQKSTDKSIHRVYFNLQGSEGIADDVVTLQSKLDSANFQVRVKEKDLKVYTDKYRSAKSQNAGLREEIKELEGKSRVTESIVCALKDQIQYFKQKSKDGERLQAEVQRLKNRLIDMDRLELVVNGTRDQVNEMLRHNQDPESLSLLVSTLKKELLETDRKKRLLNTKLGQMQNEMNEHKRKYETLKKDQERLRSDVEEHKNCERERRYLKNKIYDLQTATESSSGSTTPNTSLKRIIAESPAPYRPDLNDAVLSIQDADSPTVADRVQSIKDSDSPYLPVKSNNAGISKLLTAKFSCPLGLITAKPRVTYDKYSLFEKDMPKSNKTSKADNSYSYNGLGGHSKEDVFPTPQKALIGQKRAKPTTAVSSNKFRKLSSNAVSNKKLDDFITLS